MFQKGEETRGDLYRLASSPAVQLCDFALRSIKTELIFETIYFIESLLTGRTETNGIVAMEDQLEASGHRMASEGNAGHGSAAFTPLQPSISQRASLVRTSPTFGR